MLSLGEPKFPSIPDVTYYGTVRRAGEDYGKKPALLGFRNPPQDIVALPSCHSAK
jgi:hypothetical protein